MIPFAIATVISIPLDRRRHYYLTNRRIIASNYAILTQDLTDVRVDKSFVDRLRGTARVHFHTKSGRWLTFKRVTDAETSK